ncbi:putative uncharacterized protein [Firmicutes bacterium CAG:536]|nr:putative uncharacterized protein [Firmicutes bacterium CAG:536]
MKVYRNTKTKSVIEIVFGEAVPDGYVECFAGEVDAAQEKHVPHLEKDGTTLKVQVGSVEHPMLPEHYITAIWVELKDGTLYKQTLHANQKPEAHFDLGSYTGELTVYEYCNLHGLWKATIEF